MLEHMQVGDLTIFILLENPDGVHRSVINERSPYTAVDRGARDLSDAAAHSTTRNHHSHSLTGLDSAEFNMCASSIDGRAQRACVLCCRLALSIDAPSALPPPNSRKRGGLEPATEQRSRVRAIVLASHFHKSVAAVMRFKPI